MSSVQIFLVYSVVLLQNFFIQAPVVQKVDSGIHHINLYPVDSATGFPNTYPLERDLSDG